jgi:hypothetical protein
MSLARDPLRRLRSLEVNGWRIEPRRQTRSTGQPVKFGSPPDDARGMCSVFVADEIEALRLNVLRVAGQGLGDQLTFLELRQRTPVLPVRDSPRAMRERCAAQAAAA